MMPSEDPDFSVKCFGGPNKFFHTIPVGEEANIDWIDEESCGGVHLDPSRGKNEGAIITWMNLNQS